MNKIITQIDKIVHKSVAVSSDFCSVLTPALQLDLTYLVES